MTTINLAHGSGGEATQELIRNVFFKHLGNEILNQAADAAIVENGTLAMTTDSFVVQPLFFPGGDIGKLAICGTVNDLTVSGAQPRYISCGFIIEEGFDRECLDRIVASMAQWANYAGVKVVTGDTKVVEKGAADGLFINTAGIGSILPDKKLSIQSICPGDKVLISGPIGNHGVAVLSQRQGFAFESEIKSDCYPVNILLGDSALSHGVRFMRDPTRGGVATTLQEIVQDQSFGIMLREKDIPVEDGVRGACELLGMDPLYMANEGRVIFVVAPEDEEGLLKRLRTQPEGRKACTIGEVQTNHPGKLTMVTQLGISRDVEQLSHELVPRIC